MNHDLQIKLQAYLDGELPEREARRVGDWMTNDPEARALVSELKMTRNALRETGEAESRLPESREFYWSKIERQIERLDQQPETAPGFAYFLDRWRRYLAPLGGLALTVVIALGIVRFYGPGTVPPQISYLAEVESPAEEVGAHSFRSQSENMFVVWLYDRPVEVESEPEWIEYILP